ncbi:MAG: hypothetical protein JNL88_12455 [Bacteroidia bacterium]|nr:hypothetical protein [Bacteroidia bacterium]
MKKENLYKSAHLLSGVVVLLHGIGELDRVHGSPSFFFIAGTLMMLTAVFHHQVERRLGNGESIIFFIEAAVQLFIAFHYFEAGKKALPFAHLFCTLLYVYVGYLKLTGSKPFWSVKK